MAFDTKSFKFVLLFLSRAYIMRIHSYFTYRQTTTSDPKTIIKGTEICDKYDGKGVSLQSARVVYNRLVTEANGAGLYAAIHFVFIFFIFKYILKICINI